MGKTPLQGFKPGKKVIFLDFDGVLNNDNFLMSLDPTTPHGEGHIDPKAVMLLNTIVEITGAEIVISSSWRIPYTIEELKKFLTRRGFDHADKIIGRTPGVDRNDRGVEIFVWLSRAEETGDGAEHFVILDDNDDMKPLMQHLVRTNPDVGLCEEDMLKAIEQLGVKLVDCELAAI
jgi:hypothetical protein